MYQQFDLAREQSRDLFKDIVNDNMDGTAPYGFHSQIELYFVEEGQVEALVNGRRQLLQKGQMAVALSYDAHRFRSVGESRSAVLVIPPELCREFTAAVRDKQVQNPFICRGKEVKQIWSLAEEARKAQKNPVKLRGYLYLILGSVLENIFLEPVQSPGDTELSSRLLVYLGENFKEDITLGGLSKIFGYSQSYLSRYFKSCFGIGVIRYVNILRLQNALLLLQGGNQTHMFCAMESGFSSLRTFYRVFKEEFGVSPREYLAGNIPQ